LVKWLGFSPLVIALVMLAAFIGHLYPIFFRFEGGKGVATALGGLLALSWPVAVCWVLIWGIVVGLFRYVAVASMLASIMAPFLALVAYFLNDLTGSYSVVFNVATTLFSSHI